MDAMRGMTYEECTALRADLEAAGVHVVRVEERRPGLFWPVYWSQDLHVNCAITDATQIRETVTAGLNPALPSSIFWPRSG
jgi:hypothetical protein